MGLSTQVYKRDVSQINTSGHVALRQSAFYNFNLCWDFPGGPVVKILHFHCTGDVNCLIPGCCSVAKSCPILCDPMECSTPSSPFLQLSPRVCSNSPPLSRWCHPTISSSVVPFSHPQSYPASGSFSMSRLCIRWPKYRGFSFSISPSNEYSVWAQPKTRPKQ